MFPLLCNKPSLSLSGLSTLLPFSCIRSHQPSPLIYIFDGGRALCGNRVAKSSTLSISSYEAPTPACPVTQERKNFCPRKVVKNIFPPHLPDAVAVSALGVEEEEEEEEVGTRNHFAIKPWSCCKCILRARAYFSRILSIVCIFFSFFFSRQRVGRAS